MRAVALVVLLALLVLAIGPDLEVGLAQGALTCPQVVDQAFAGLGTNCANLGPNSVCYGFSRVQAQFANAADGDAFGAPGDRAPLTTLQRIQTGAMNAADGAWGIAIMNVQANIPAGLSDQVVYMMLGDVTVENAVAPEEALAPVDPITVTTSAQANLYNAPGKNAAVVGTFPAGSLLEADGVSPDGQWLRVLHVTGVAWVPQEAVEANDAINDLPLIDRNARAPMQSFRLTTGTGTAPCVEAVPSVLVVQGPQNFPADITANGVNIRVLSTIFLRTLPGNVLQIITGNGTAIIHPDTPNEIVVPPAFSVTFALDESGSAADAVPSWTLLNQREIDQFAALVDIPGNVWNFAYQPPVIIQPSGVGRPTPTVVPTGRPPRPPRPPFPIIPWPPGRPGRGIPRGPWQRVVIGGPTCPPWLFYHSDRDGDWDIYRLGNARLGNTVNNNVSQGLGSADIQPSASADGEWVAFTSNRDVRGSWEIWIAKADGTFQQRVTYNTAIDINPEWGPGNLIVFESTRDANWELYLVDVSGTGEPTRLTDDPAYDINPFWSPDGTKIVFQSDRDGDWEIYMLDIDTGELTQLTDNDTEDQVPVLSHDGEAMAWIQMNAYGVYDLWLMDLETGEVKQLTDTGADIAGHQFAPDDTFVAYHTNIDGDFDIFAVDVETGEIKNVTDTPEVEDRAPTFWCNTSIVVFHSDRIESLEKPGQREIFEVDALPIDGPAGAAARLTSFPLDDDIYPLGDPREEVNSREGRMPPSR